MAEIPTYPYEISQFECSGDGKCHGCLKWCDSCGDVSATCHAEECDAHRCNRCNHKLSLAEQEYAYAHDPDWWKWCAACHRQDAIEKAEREVLDCAAKADHFRKLGDPVEAANYDNATETYAWHYKRLVAGEWP